MEMQLFSSEAYQCEATFRKINMEGNHLLKMHLLFTNGAFPLSIEIFVFFLSHSADFKVNHVNFGGGRWCHRNILVLLIPTNRYAI